METSEVMTLLAAPRQHPGHPGRPRSRTRGSSPAARSTPTTSSTSASPARCTRPSSARRSRTRASSSVDTSRRARRRPAWSRSSPPTTSPTCPIQQPTAARWYPPAMAQPLLAADVVRFVGEPVAVVVTEERYQGEDAAELVDVDYEPLPAVVDPRGRRARRGAAVPRAPAPTSCVLAVGEPRAGDDFFAGCEVVVEPARSSTSASPPRRWRSARAAAVWGDDGRLHRLDPQPGRAGHASGRVAGMLGARRRRSVRVDHARRRRRLRRQDRRLPRARRRRAGSPGRLGRPVRWVETRSENMVAMTHGRGAGADRHDRRQPRRHASTAYRLHVAAGRRRLPEIGAMLPTLTALMAPGVYDIPSSRRRSRSVVTNTTPIGAYRGAGRPEATAADRAGDGPVRRRDRHGPGRGAPAQPAARVHRAAHARKGGATYDGGDYAAALDKVLDGRRLRRAARRAGGAPRARRRRAARHRAVGLRRDHRRRRRVRAAARERDGRGARRRHGDVLTGTSPHGQGHATAWAMLASEQIGIPMEQITVIWGDTDLVPSGGGTMGSRWLQQGGAAVHQAAAASWSSVAKQLRRRPARGRPAATSWSTSTRPASPSPASPASGVTLRRARRRSEPLLVAHACSARRGATYPFGAHVAVVEVDIETGQGRAGAARRASTTPARSSTRCSPRASGTAASPRARPRRCSRRCATTTTATRSRRPSPTTPIVVGDRAAELRARHHGDADAATTRSAPRASASRARSARRRPCRTPSSTPSAHLGVRHIDMPTRPSGSGGRWPPRAGSPPDENVPLSCVHAG